MHGDIGERRIIMRYLTKKTALQKAGYVPRSGRPSLMPGEESITVQFRLGKSEAMKLGENTNEKAREIVRAKIWESAISKTNNKEE